MTDTTHNVVTDLVALERSLERQAHAAIAAHARDETAGPRVFLVCDFEYKFRREAHGGWAYGREPKYDQRGRRKEEKIRWPFHTIAAAAWMVVRFDGQSDIPEIAEPVVMTLGETDLFDRIIAKYHRRRTADRDSGLGGTGLPSDSASEGNR